LAKFHEKSLGIFGGSKHSAYLEVDTLVAEKADMLDGIVFGFVYMHTCMDFQQTLTSNTAASTAVATAVATGVIG
jgi:hypothetical protein